MDKFNLTQTGEQIQADLNRVESLEINPTIPSGTTLSSLTGIKDGTNYYKVGGTKFYRHTISNCRVFNASGTQITGSTAYIICTKNTPFTQIAFAGVGDLGVILGCGYNGNSRFVQKDGPGCMYIGWVGEYYAYSSSTPTTSFTYITNPASGTITDTVEEI